MIKIIIKKDSIIADGHANYEISSKDIVCSAVSAVIVGSLNCFDKKDISTKIESGYVSLKIHHMTNTYQTILNTLIVQLKTIEQSYSQYIKIIEKGE